MKLLHNTRGSAIFVGPGVVRIEQRAPDCFWVGSMYITDSYEEAVKLKERYEARRIVEHMASKKSTAPKNAKNTGRKQSDDDDDDDDEDEDEDEPRSKKLTRKPVKGGKVNAPEDDEDEDEDEDEDDDEDDDDDEDEDEAPKGKKSSKSASKKQSKSDDDDDDDDDEDEKPAKKSSKRGPDLVKVMKLLQSALDELKPKN
jgi:hypothetical protein